MAADLEAMGAAREEVERFLADTETVRNCEVWPENWPAVCLFLACTTQWRIESRPDSNLPIGLDYPAVEAVMRIHEVSDCKAMFAQIQIMELAALQEFRRKVKRR